MNNTKDKEYYGFIYMTTNHINNKKYIGQKKYDKDEKWKDYLGSGVILNKAIKKYGKENFSKEIIENCYSKKELDKREIYWIKYYDAVKSEDFYNIANGGNGGNTLAGYTEEQRTLHSEILSKAFKGIINQGANNPCAKKTICLNNMIIFNTTVEAAKYGNTSDYLVQSCCQGKSLTAGTDPITGERLTWEYYKEGKEYIYIYIKPQRKNNHLNINKIVCYTTNEIFDTIYDASKKYELSISGIYECCNFKYSYCGKLNDGTPLQWFYYNYFISDEFDIKNHPLKIKIYKVYMYDFSGNFIKEFNTQYEANKYIGNRSNGVDKILKCCNEECHTAFNYIWRFYKVDKIDVGFLNKYSLPKNRKIYQYTTDMILLHIYNNAKEASYAIKGNKSGVSNIRCCCAGNSKTAYGFIWKYENDITV